ncbi:MAG TPA: phytanoyl-CoA dioxygenase family protein [Thermoanaerobaculia bacterium]
MRTPFLSSELQQSFVRDGYVTVPLLSPDEVRYVAAELQKLRPADNFRRRLKRRFLPGSLTYHCTFLDRNVEYKRRTRELIFELLRPRVGEVLDGYDFLNASFYVKPPGSGVFQVHQNWPHLTDMADTTISIWCPLVDTDRHNGTIEVIPSSHKIVPDIACTNMPPFFDAFEETLIEKYLRPVPMKAGESLFFDDSLIHWSSENDSAEPRVAIQAICLPAGAQPVYYHLDPARPDRFELFEVDPDYFITHTGDDLADIPKERKSLGYVPNPNRSLTETEFAERLANGESTRRALWSGRTTA